MRIHLLKITLFGCLLSLLAHSYSCTVEEDAPVSTADATVDTGPTGPDLELLDDGLSVDGATIALGSTIAAAAELLGEAEQVQEMGGAGTVYSYPLYGVELWKEGGDTIVAIHLVPGYTGGAANTIVPGADDSLVVEVLGIGVADPFGLGRHYPDMGLFVGTRNEKVESVTLSVVK